MWTSEENLRLLELFQYLQKTIQHAMFDGRNPSASSNEQVVYSSKALSIAAGLSDSLNVASVEVSLGLRCAIPSEDYTAYSLQRL